MRKVLRNKFVLILAGLFLVLPLSGAKAEKVTGAKPLTVKPEKLNFGGNCSGWLMAVLGSEYRGTQFYMYADIGIDRNRWVFNTREKRPEALAALKTTLGNIQREALVEGKMVEIDYESLETFTANGGFINPETFKKLVKVSKTSAP